MKKLFLMFAVALCVVGCNESDEGVALYNGMVNSFVGTALDEATLVAGLISGVTLEVDAYAYHDDGWVRLWGMDGYGKKHWIFYNGEEASVCASLTFIPCEAHFDIQWRYDETTRCIHTWHKESDMGSVYRVSYCKFPDLILDRIYSVDGVEKVESRRIYRIVDKNPEELLAEYPNTYEDVLKEIEGMYDYDL